MCLNIMPPPKNSRLVKGSGNEREIFNVMLDKSTYLKKLVLSSSQSVFFMYNANVQNVQLNFHFWPQC